MDLFLNVDKKKWVIKDLELPVIEDVPMKDLKWFRDKTMEAEELKNDPKATVTDGIKFDEAWWEKTCELGLGKTKDEILESGISERQFRNLMAEVYHFLSVIGTIEEAKQLGLYAAETKKKDSKP